MNARRRLVVRSKAHFAASRVAVAALAIGALVFAGCDGEPVSESVSIAMLDANRAALTLHVTIDRESYDEKGGDSILQFARSLLEHTGLWDQRFSELAADREIERSEKREGQLVEYTRSVEVAHDEIQRFFADSSLTILETSGPGWREFSIVPGESRRASRDVQRFVNRTFDEWSSEIAEYTNATADLYRYLDAQPQRAEALLGHVFIEQLTEEERNRIGAIAEEEEPYVSRVRRAMRAAIERADVDSRDAAVIAIAARLVYDPFPSQLTIEVPGDVIEVEGFRERSARVYEVPQRSVWEVLLTFENRWNEPELLTTLVDATQDPSKPVDLAALAARRRITTGGISDSDVKTELEKALRPAAGYRIRWTE